jgi:hypothetical protein
MTTVISSNISNTIEIFAKIFANKDKQDDVSDTINEEYLEEIAGRVTRGSEESHFEYLQKDAGAKRFAWVMGADGLILFLKKSNIQALRSIGCEDRWIRKKLEDGEYFRLGVFYRLDKCVPATWDGILSLIDKCYSKSISTKIYQHADTLKRMSFDEIEARARLSYLQGASYFDIDELSINGYSTDPRFMSEERFEECEGTLEESRGFLYNRLGLSCLFDGSGFTKDSKGKLCAREYLQPNVPVRDLPGFRYLNLPIDNADLMPSGGPASKI